MKVSRTLLWTMVRAGLAVVLLVVVMRYFISVRDTVFLADGARAYGRIVMPETGALDEGGVLRLRANGHVVEYEKVSAEAATADWIDWRQGSFLRKDKVVLANGVVLKGKISKAPSAGDDTIIIDAGQGEITVRHADMTALAGRWVRYEPGLLTILETSEPHWFVTGFLLLGIVPFIAAWRWQMLLVAQDIPVKFVPALELTFIGLFFNNVMIGLTGGDFIKAYYAARLTPDRKTHAVVTVFLDRIIGLVALGIVAAVAVVIALATTKGESDIRFQQAGWLVAVFVVASVGGSLIFFSRRLRRAALAVIRMTPGYERLCNTKPGHRFVDILKKVDSAVFLYRSRKAVLFWTTAISFIAHASAILSIYAFGRALGVTQPTVTQFFIVVPVSFIISSVPITPAGWGVGEYVFIFLFGAVGVGETAAVAMSIIYRLTQAMWTLPGGVWLIFHRERAKVEELEREMDVAEALLEKEDGVEGD